MTPPARPLLIGFAIAVALFSLLMLADRAGAQEPTTTTTESTTTTEAPTTTTSTTVPPTTTTTVPPIPDYDATNPIGSRESAQWLALIAAFVLGHLLTR